MASGSSTDKGFILSEQAHPPDEQAHPPDEQAHPPDERPHPHHEPPHQPEADGMPVPWPHRPRFTPLPSSRDEVAETNNNDPAANLEAECKKESQEEYERSGTQPDAGSPPPLSTSLSLRDYRRL
ncbi:hypothetical protein PTTG_27723 [Puccinia triticina 1-1 BBBD Race 1]|uniref:Uncharacterized protein n=2 Tax=Puccinia triticina TaxID=208348 RepID=A0A180GHI2_PUCT1|nr:uncharacterized protein PtA15_3A303 [Puccinia triticina]OAV92135.1 hypothetical protein PTTG_27723 [Puccinia triticina 1-1 BBBD Race 1]WAQ82938.1 hypothetical protein PtA15_3A303 [Puccinia triticina]WAR53761.1 hypothetical protein PtB15_3B270 [Puccinia triticina]